MKIVALSLIYIVMFAFPCKAQEKEAPRKLYPIQQNGRVGFIDDTGKIVIKPQFDEAWNFQEGLAPVRVRNKWGYINEAGKIVIPLQFSSVMPFQEGVASVGAFFKPGSGDGQSGNYGYIDKSGKFIIKPQFDIAFDFSDGMTQVKLNDEDAYIDKTGKVMFWHNWLTEDFFNGRALFKTHSNMSDSMIGYLDKTGKIAINPKFDWGESFSEGVACVSLNKKDGFIDTQGNVAIDFRFDGCRSFSEGLAAVRVGDKWGYIDKSGKIVIEPQYAEAEKFSDNVAVVRVVEESQSSKKEEKYKEGENITSVKLGKFAVIDRNEKIILPAQFVQIGSFSGGLAWVNLDEGYIVCGSADKWGYINKAGKFVWKSFADKKRSTIRLKQQGRTFLRR